MPRSSRASGIAPPAPMWSALRQAKLAAGMPRKQLIGFGTSFGKFTKGKKFRLHVTCLDYVAQHAQHKVWLKPSAELDVEGLRHSSPPPAPAPCWGLDPRVRVGLRSREVELRSSPPEQRLRRCRAAAPEMAG